MARILIVLLLCAAPLLAGEIGVTAPDGRAGWLLLENPLGPGGDGLSAFAGDPGLPVSDPMNWAGRYPVTELWRFESGRYTRVTHALDGAGATFPRTLHAVFEAGGAPFVLHFDPRRSLGGLTQILRVDGLQNAGGQVPPESILFNSPDVLDAPAVSPDRRHLVVRAFRQQQAGFESTLRVIRLADWKQIAETQAMQPGRPVWLDNECLAVIDWKHAIPRPDQRGPGRAMTVPESHAPQPGRVVRLRLEADTLHAQELLAGSFPPDRLTQSLLADPFGLGLLLARQDGEHVVVELRAPIPDGRAQRLARFERFRGMAAAATRASAAGAGDAGLELVTLYRRTRVSMQGLSLSLPDGADGEIVRTPLPEVSSQPHGGMLDLGRGVIAFLEPVVNPDYSPAAPRGIMPLRHVLVVPQWPGCDSLRNPRLLARVSALVRSFEAAAAGGEIASTQLIFDIEIVDGDVRKHGRYVELYARNRRGGQGAIRIEHNLGGEWTAQVIESRGGRDYYYDLPELQDSELRERAAEVAGRDYDDLRTQLEARRLLMLNGVAREADAGGLAFRGRQRYRDPISGLIWRVWVFEKLGGYLEPERAVSLHSALAAHRSELRESEGAQADQLRERIDQLESELAQLPRERALLRFVADLPIGAAGSWDYAHALARVGMRFAMAGGRPAAATELTFEPSRFVSLPNLSDAPGQQAQPPLLLPAEFRVIEFREGETATLLTARAVVPPQGRDAIPHPEELVRARQIRPGYDVPGIDLGPRMFTRKQR